MVGKEGALGGGWGAHELELGWGAHELELRHGWLER